MATIGKKFGQFKQWTGERLGTAEKTNVSEDFRKLDLETQSRKDGMEKLAIALTDYAKTLDKRSSQDKKVSAISMLAKSMIQQGKFHGESTMIGLALVKIGETEDRIQGLQQEFAETVRQGLLMEIMALYTSMKDYDSLKKKLENRRLDYDAKLNKFNKSKKDKPGLEEEMKTSQKKYNETLTDVENLMSTFAEREDILLRPLIEFAEAQFNFFSKSLEGLTELQSALSEEIQENSNNGDKAILIRKNSTLKTVLPAGLDNSTKSSRNNSHDEEEFGGSETPKPMSNISGNPASRLGKNSSKSQSGLEVVEAVYDFAAENEGELSITKGDKIKVTSYIDEGWWHGTCNDQEGIFPSNYVKRIPKEKAPPKQEAQKIVRNKEPTRPSEQSTKSAIKSCSDCGCNEFTANVFKPNKCNNCFHEH